MSGMATGELLEERLTHSVIGAFYEVYNNLGYGFVEYLYLAALERELAARGHTVAREYTVHIRYKGAELGTQRIDMIVDERLVLEAKSNELLHKSASRQVYNYLRATNLEVGLLLHFGPEPNFLRLICRNKRSNSPHLPNSPHPLKHPE
jgi:GxxExxY protein